MINHNEIKDKNEKKKTLHRYETNRPRSIKFHRKDQF